MHHGSGDSGVATPAGNHGSPPHRPKSPTSLLPASVPRSPRRLSDAAESFGQSEAAALFPSSMLAPPSPMHRFRHSEPPSPRGDLLSSAVSCASADVDEKSPLVPATEHSPISAFHAAHAFPRPASPFGDHVNSEALHAGTLAGLAERRAASPVVATDPSVVSKKLMSNADDASSVKSGGMFHFFCFRCFELRHSLRWLFL